MRAPDGRYDLDRALVAATGELAAANPALAHVEARRLVFVAAAARRRARASIRPLTFGGSPPRLRSKDGRYEKPVVVRAGARILYEIALRPAFLFAEPAERLRVLAHELWHIAPAFDGTLAPERKHRPGQVDDPAPDLVLAWVAAFPDSPARAILGARGEARLSAWLRRPPSLLAPGDPDASYDDRDLYSAIVELA